MAALIWLPKNTIVIVSDEDGDLTQHTWRIDTYKTRRTSYAFRRDESTNEYISMHRTILSRMIGRALTRNEDVDHRDHHGLNNQRSNLRLATRAENKQNQQKPRYKKGSTSIYKGVSWNKADKRWHAFITIEGKSTYLGCTKIEVHAAYLYDAAARKHFGEFALPNLPVA